MDIIQVKQISRFLSAYHKDIVEEGIKAWRVEEILNVPEVIQGKVTDVQLDKRYDELDMETKQFLKEQSEEMLDLLPLCSCGKKLNLMGVCGGCKRGSEGFKSKFVCSCGYEEYFKATVREKIEQLRRF